MFSNLYRDFHQALHLVNFTEKIKCYRFTFFFIELVKTPACIPIAKKQKNKTKQKFKLKKRALLDGESPLLNLSQYMYLYLNPQNDMNAILHSGSKTTKICLHRESNYLLYLGPYSQRDSVSTFYVMYFKTCFYVDFDGVFVLKQQDEKRS